MMYGDEATWFALMNHLVQVSIDYVVAQVEAGRADSNFRLMGWSFKCSRLSLLY